MHLAQTIAHAASWDNTTLHLPFFTEGRHAAAVVDLTHLQQHLRQDADVLWQQLLLSPSELDLFTSFTFEKRYVEWLGGRIAAKYALRTLCYRNHRPQPVWSECSILPDQVGRPTLFSAPELACSVSISHSSRYAAALVSLDTACGLDIQYQTDKLVRLREKFSDVLEQQVVIPIGNSLTGLTLIWTAKEAVKKCALSQQPGLFHTIRVTAMESGKTSKDWTLSCSIREGSYTNTIMVSLMQWRGYLCAFCTRKHASKTHNPTSTRRRTNAGTP